MSSEVKRYDVSRGHLYPSGALAGTRTYVKVVTARDYDTLRAEVERLRAERLAAIEGQEPVADGELLPCPFCGSPAEETEKRGWYACSNGDCHAYHTTALLENWNRRVRIDAALALAKGVPEGWREARVVGFKPGMGHVTLDVGGRLPAWLDMGHSCYVATRPAQPEQRPEEPPSGITVERDFFGTIHIKLGDFDFIQIQSQYPYTDNAGTRALAEKIVALLSSGAAHDVLAAAAIAQQGEGGAA